jgi:hypothetical protein
MNPNKLLAASRTVKFLQSGKNATSPPKYDIGYLSRFLLWLIKSTRQTARKDAAITLHHLHNH